MSGPDGANAGHHVLVTGAGGYLGAMLTSRLLRHPAFAASRFTLADRRLDGVDDERVATVVGDLSDPATRRRCVGDSVDLVFHLAAVLGGAAEADYALARRVNVDTSLALLEDVRDAPRRDASTPPRVVFASSIAVFGPPVPARIDEDTLPRSPRGVFYDLRPSAISAGAAGSTASPCGCPGSSLAAAPTPVRRRRS